MRINFKKQQVIIPCRFFIFIQAIDITPEGMIVSIHDITWLGGNSHWVNFFVLKI